MLRQRLVFCPGQPCIQTDFLIDHPVVSGINCSSVRSDAGKNRILHNHSPDGAEAGRLYLLGADHFAVAIPGAALNGRIIHERLRRSVYYTALDDEPIARVEYGLERILTREQFGEWFPRRYIAEVIKPPEEVLLTLALSVPFLGFDALEVR